MTGFLESIFSNVWWSAIVKVVIAWVVMLLIALLLVWFERKVVADMQNR